MRRYDLLPDAVHFKISTVLIYPVISNAFVSKCPGYGVTTLPSTRKKILLTGPNEVSYRRRT